MEAAQTSQCSPLEVAKPHKTFQESPIPFRRPRAEGWPTQWGSARQARGPSCLLGSGKGMYCP